MTDWMYAPDDDPFQNWPGVPPHLRAGLVAYAKEHRPTGGFLAAVLRNDLCQAFARADDRSLAGVYDVCGWLYNEAPSQCWGSPDKVVAWLSARPKEIDA